jgi:hypothetical protein
MYTLMCDVVLDGNMAAGTIFYVYLCITSYI